MVTLFYITIFLCCLVWFFIGVVAIVLVADNYIKNEKTAKEVKVENEDPIYWCEECECLHELDDFGQKYNC